jgi:hypothetical protein
VAHLLRRWTRVQCTRQGLEVVPQRKDSRACGAGFIPAARIRMSRRSSRSREDAPIVREIRKADRSRTVEGEPRRQIVRSGAARLLAESQRDLLVSWRALVLDLSRATLRIKRCLRFFGRSVAVSRTAYPRLAPRDERAKVQRLRQRQRHSARRARADDGRDRRHQDIFSLRPTTVGRQFWLDSEAGLPDGRP